MDVFILRSGMLGLLVICVVCAGGIAVVAALGHEPPNTLVYMGSSAFGVLVGVFINPKRPPGAAAGGPAAHCGPNGRPGADGS